MNLLFTLPNTKANWYKKIGLFSAFFSLLMFTQVTQAAHNPFAITKSAANVCDGEIELTVDFADHGYYPDRAVGFNAELINVPTATKVDLGDDQIPFDGKSPSTGALPIGFTFEFYEEEYTEFYIDHNGFISFSDLSPFAENEETFLNQALPDSTQNEPNNLIAAVWADLDPSSGTIEYYTTGSAPNRKLVVNFIELPYFNSTATVTAQIVLEETTNIITINAIDVQADATEQPTTGIEDATGEEAVTVAGRNNTDGSNWEATNDRVSFVPLHNFSFRKWRNTKTQEEFTTPTITVGDTTANTYKFEIDITTRILTGEVSLGNAFTVDVEDEYGINTCEENSITLGGSPLVPESVENRPFAVFGNSDQLVLLDEFTAAGDVTANYLCGDFGDNGYFYALSLDNTLDRIDRVTGEVTVVGASVPATGHLWSGLAFRPTNNVMYAVSSDISNSILYAIDLYTGNAAPIAEIKTPTGAPVQFVTWLAINEEGEFFIHDLLNDELLTTTTAGESTLVNDNIGLFDPRIIFFQDADFDDATGNLNVAYLIDTDGDGINELAGVLEFDDTGSFVGGGGLYNATTGSGGVAIAILPEPDFSYAWIPATGLDNPTSPNPVFTGDTETAYTLNVVDDNSGCVKSQTVNVKVVTGIEIVGNSGIANDGMPSEGPLSPFASNTHNIVINGGTAPFSFLWDIEGNVTKSSDPTTGSATISYTGNAEWSVTITDASGCGIANGGSETIFANNGLSAGLDNAILDIEDFTITPDGGDGTGAIDITVDGGDPAYNYQWSHGATTEDVTGLAKGWYIVTVTDQDGDKAVEWFWVPRIGRPTSTKSSVDATNFLNYPNPVVSTTTFQVEITADTPVNLSVYSLDGRKQAEVFNGELLGGNVYQFEFDASNLPNGMYMTKLITNTGETVGKFLKNN